MRPTEGGITFVSRPLRLTPLPTFRSKIQVIGMSATLSEYMLMAAWIGAKVGPEPSAPLHVLLVLSNLVFIQTFSSTFRPIELREFVLMGDKVYALGEDGELRMERELDGIFPNREAINLLE